MFGKLRDKSQREPFRPMLTDFIDPRHESVLPANAIDRPYFDSESEKHYYGNNGRLAPYTIRLTAGCPILERMYNYGDETLPEDRIRENCTAFSSDAEPYKKVTDKCNEIAEKKDRPTLKTY